MNAPCDRFEREALLLIEEGKPLPEHFTTCPECLRAHAAYQRLRAELQRPIDAGPRVGWEEDVLREMNRPTIRRSYWTVGGLTAAAVIGLLVMKLSPTEESLALEVATSHAGAPMRGDNAHPGDKLSLRAQAGGLGHAELRVYRDDRELVMRCAPPASGPEFSCAREGNAVVGELRLGQPGAYQAFLAASEHPLPEPASTFGEDSGRLIAAGAKMVLAPAVRVY